MSMWITRLELRNIKSYGDSVQEIEFRPGVNLIRGENGAGKSTILEAIGLALFDSIPYTPQRQFVSEGAKSGQITVGFLSRIDEREYLVVREIGGRSAYYIYDPEIDQRVVSGKEDTMDRLRDHLGVEPGSDLSELFRNAIGVPQGTMTAIFMEGPKQRRDKFNQLLRVGDYERAWEQLRETGNYIRDLMDANARQQAELHGELKGLKETEEKIEEFSGLVKQDRDALAEITGRLRELATALELLDELEQQLDSIDETLQKMEAEIGVLRERLQRAEEDVQAADEAANVVVETRESHRAYENAQAQLDELDEVRQERDRQVKAQHDLDTQLQLCEQSLKQLSTELEAVEAAEAEVARLEPLVEQQWQLEDELARVQADEAEYERLSQQVARHENTLGNLNTRLESVAQSVAEKERIEIEHERQEPPDDDLNVLDARVNDVRDKVSQLENTYERLRDAHEAQERLQAELEELEQGLQERTQLQRQLDELEQERDTAQTQEQEARLRLEQIAREARALDKHYQMLGAADARCPVCQRPLDEHSRADSEAHYERERQRLEAERRTAETQVETAQEQLQSLETKRDTLNRQLKGLPNEAALIRLQTSIDEAETTLDERLQEVVAQLRVAWGAWVTAMELLDRARTRAEALADSKEQGSKIEARLAELGDPARAYERAQDEATKREDIEERQAEQEKKRGALRGQLAEIERKLADYADLDARIKEAQTQRAANEDAHRRYLAYEQVASKLPELQAQRVELQQQFESLQTQQAQVQSERTKLAADYDAARHESLRQEHRKQETTQAAIAERLKGNEKLLEEAQQKQADLERRQEELATLERAADRLAKRQEAFDFVRKGIRDAGPRITRQLVRAVAAEANRIFGDIMGDSSFVLNWSEDYAVSVNYRGEERAFELLSGGEQMAAAIAVRLALLTQLADVRFAFFDEPTANLDGVRREQLAERLGAIRSLQQVFVISHDNTFEGDSDHIIEVRKVNGISQVETR